MILLDTHALIWLANGDSKLGGDARRQISLAWEDSNVAVSAITFWEVAMLRQKRPERLPEDVGLWRRELLEQGMVEIPVDGAIGIRATSQVDLHRDPADRIIVATALEGHQLVTADDRILDWPGELSRLDARK